MSEMATYFWVNLPVKELEKSMEFFRALGYTVSKQNEMGRVAIGEQNSPIILVQEAAFQQFAENGLADSAQSTEVLLSISADTRDEVHEMCQKVVQAGGSVFSEPGEFDGMYGAGFTDLDGHRWNLLVM